MTMDPNATPPSQSPESTGGQRPASRIDDALEREIDAALGDVRMSDLVELAGDSDGGKSDTESEPAPTRASRAPSGGGGGRPKRRSGGDDRGRERKGGGRHARGGRDGRDGRGAPPPRQARMGKIVRIHDGDVFVEFTNLSQGVCPLVQFGDAVPEIGGEHEFIIERMDAFEGLLVLSRPGATQKADWGSLEEGQVVEARAVGMNKGGLEMEIAHHKGFMPAGQVDIRHVPDISVFLGQKFPCLIIELRKDKGRIILSRKAALAQDRARKRDEVLAGLEEGHQVRATVTSVQPYGAFADVGGVDGLIHIADLAHERLKHPSEVVKVGDEVEVKILRIDRSQNPPKIALGRKQVMADPILQKLAEVTQGATLTGRVTRLTDFGAFVEIAAGLEGLVHISEVSHDRIPSVDRVLKRDQIVTAKVLSVDSDRKRVSLSIKALVDRPVQQQGRGRDGDPQPRGDGYLRDEDPAMRKLKAKFAGGGKLKGGLS